MERNLPTEYVFVLSACYEAECNHPICQRGRPTDELHWRTQCSVLAFISARFKAILGTKECKNCDGFCTGHLVCLEKVLATDSNDLLAAHTYPPNNAIKESFVKAQKESRD